MKVFKFGGASVKDAKGIRNIANVLSHYKDSKVFIIVSAMGKTTNALVEIVDRWFKNEDIESELNYLEDYHLNIAKDLFGEEADETSQVKQEILALKSKLNSLPKDDFGFCSDQLVSFGELMSSKILSAFLNITEFNNVWLDARDIVKTDFSFTEGKVNWQKSKKQFDSKVNPLIVNNESNYFVSQGFIGSNDNEDTVTLGREGSDFSAAIFAYLTNAEKVAIWKDVPGMLNADPKWFDNTVKLDRISYKEALELAYYGASVIHPKTIKPLQNKQIPLYVKSFLEPTNEGTVIQERTDYDTRIPSFIFKMNQSLVSISPRDFSFIIEENLQHIFGCFAEYGIKINLMQNSALNFSICVDETPRLSELINVLKEKYKVLYNQGLELVTIRHYDDETINRVIENKEILVEQKSRDTARMVMRNL